MTPDYKEFGWVGLWSLSVERQWVSVAPQGLGAALGTDPDEEWMGRKWAPEIIAELKVGF